MSDASSKTEVEFVKTYIMSTADPIGVAAAKHPIVEACFILASGARIWYRPQKAGGPWQAIVETCGRRNEGAR